MASDHKKTADEIDLDIFLAESDDLLDEFPYDTVEPDEETPNDVKPDEMGVEVSMYLGWAIDSELVSEELEAGCITLIDKFRKRGVLSRLVLKECCADKLEVKHLNELGNAFTRCYYRPGWDYFYYEDLDELFPELTSFVYLQDNTKNYEAVYAMINSRFEEWKKQNSS